MRQPDGRWRNPTSRAVAAALAVVLGAGLLAGCGGGNTGASDALAERTSPERPAAEMPGSGSEDEAEPVEREPVDVETFCSAFRTWAEGRPDGTIESPADAAAIVDAFRHFATIAPDDDVASDFSTMADSFAVLEELEMSSTEDPDGFAAFFEAMIALFDPELAAAIAGVESYLVENCGFDPAELEEQLGSPTDPSDPVVPGPTDSVPAAGAELDLDDVDAIEEANAGASWVERANSTTILNDTLVQLSAPAEADDFGGSPFTPDEALAACEALRLGLETGRPGLQIEILNGDTVVVRGAAGVPCTAA